MPTITYQGQAVECEEGDILRDVLLDAGLSPHNSTKAVSCQGHGTCGTCAVAIDGPVDPQFPEGRERWRLNFPPHSADQGLRLSCQVRVAGDLDVEKFGGFWGQHVDHEDAE
jgi:ferredoxin